MLKECRIDEKPKAMLRFGFDIRHSKLRHFYEVPRRLRGSG
jgi:hypothetical protein